MDTKLTMLFFLIGSIIGLSHLNEEFLARVRRPLAGLRWRPFIPRRRKL